MAPPTKMLDFDQLPSKAVEALPVVRFRLKKLLPFDVDEAVVSYQVMSSAKGSVQVLAVAVPKSVLDEYEGVVTAAGYLPGAVLPSTLAALAGLDEAEVAALVVNAGPNGVTTAIVKGGVLLLHRSVDMAGDAAVERAAAVSLVDRESSAQEWAQQEAVGPGGYDRFDAEAAMQTQVLEQAEMREMAATAATYEVTQAVSVAAAYFEDTLRACAGGCVVGWDDGRGDAGDDAAGERARGPAGARDGGRRDAGAVGGDGECAAGLAGRCPGSAEELMRISVNLATRPFIELRPLFARLRLAAVALVLLAVGLGFGLHSLNAKAAKAQAQMDALKAKTAHFQDERQRNETRMRQPQNMAVLERSQFLNAVFARKSFSWTAVMMDLEKVLPAGCAGDEHRAGRLRRKAT